MGYESAKKNVESFKMVYKKLAERRKLMEQYGISELEAAKMIAVSMQ